MKTAFEDAAAAASLYEKEVLNQWLNVEIRYSDGAFSFVPINLFPANPLPLCYTQTMQVDQLREENAQAVKESKAAAFALREYRAWVDQELTDITDQILTLQVANSTPAFAQHFVSNFRTHCC